MKKIMTALLSVFLGWSIFLMLPSSTQAKDYFYIDNGISVQGRTLLPLRDLFETIKATVHYDAKTKTITATKDGKKIVLKIGSKQGTVNGKVMALDVPPVVIDGTTFLPVRFVAESLGATASYKAEIREAILTMKDIEISIFVSPAYNINGVDTKFGLNPAYTYEYIPYEGLDRYTFVGTKNGGNVWRNDYYYAEKEPPVYLTYKETKDGLYITRDGYPTRRLIKYPVYVGQSWSEQLHGQTIHYKIVSTGITYNTRVKQFSNVIRILTSDDIYIFYAAGIGDLGFEARYYEYMGGLVTLKKR